MSMIRDYSKQLVVLGAAGVLFVGIGWANAEQETSILVKPATPTADVHSGPTLPPPANPNEAAETRAPLRTAAPAESAEPELLPTPPQVKRASESRGRVEPGYQSSSGTTKQPFMRPAVPRGRVTGRLVDQESSRIVGAPPQEAPSQVAPRQQAPPQNVLPSAPETFRSEIKVLPAPPIEYDTDHDARKLYRSGKIDMMMVTQNPADGCWYEIPLCIPACCEGEPSVAAGRGLLGRGVVEYCWPCGFRAIVKFRQILGDVKVEYEGD